MGLLRRLDIIVLALMLARVVAIVGHAAYRYQSIRRSPATDDSRKMFAAELSPQLYTLRSIAHSAPFLGLAGSCVGILDSFTGIGMQRGTALAIISLNLSRAPITTAAALLVTVPAIWSYNHLRTLLDLLEIEISGRAHQTIRYQCVGIAQSLPLKKQFSRLPSSAVTVAPCLALVIVGFMTFSSFSISRGLPVGLQRPHGLAARNEYFAVDPAVVAVAIGGDGMPVLYVDSMKTPWGELRTTVENELKLRPRKVVYVEGENGVRWMDVANVIDLIEPDATVVLSTMTPDMKSLRGGRPELGNGH
jgi:hypothetical protein